MPTVEAAPEIITKVPDAEPGAVRDTGPQFEYVENSSRVPNGEDNPVDKMKITSILHIDPEGKKAPYRVYYGPGGPIPTNPEATTPEINEKPQDVSTHESLARRALKRILSLRRSKKSQPTDTI